MANKFYNRDKPRSNPEMKKSGAKGSFMEKPGFPSASLPGKAQPSDRSNGIGRAKVDPKRLGL